MTTRAKFRIDTITRRSWGNGVEVVGLDMSAVTSGGSEENKGFWEATPSGTLHLDCLNKKAVEGFSPGQEVYIDITLADA